MGLWLRACGRGDVGSVGVGVFVWGVGVWVVCLCMGVCFFKKNVFICKLFCLLVVSCFLFFFCKSSKSSKSSKSTGSTKTKN